jgi:multiple sugar transport system substrate-binding protein
VLYYNKTIFNEAGMDYPNETWTYDDLLEAAKALTKDLDGDGKTDQWGLLAGMDYLMLDSLIKAQGGAIIGDDYRSCRLGEPSSLAAIQWMTDLSQKYGVSPPPESPKDALRTGHFLTGKLAMQITGSWNVVTFADIEDFEWDIALVPKGSAGRIISAWGDLVSIGSTTEHPEEAWEWIKFLLSIEVQSDWDLMGRGSVPILTAAADNAWLTQAGQPGNAQVLIDSGQYAVSPDFGPGWFEWRWSAVVQELGAALLGEKSVEEAVETACESMEAILAEVE